MIRWLLARPGPGLDDHGFLCLSEIHEGRRYRHPGRYRQWLLGRAAAKTLLERTAGDLALDLPPQKLIHVRRTPDGWPQPLTIKGTHLPVSLTISHSGEQALCAVCPDTEGTIGADIEVVADRSRHFYEDYYTDHERTLLEQLPDDWENKAGTVIWCIKEAVLKAQRTGFHQSTTSVDVLSLDLADPRTWKKAIVETRDGTRPEVYWRLSADETMAMAIARIPA